MGWIRRETEKGTTQYICPNCHDYHEFREDFGEQTFSENFIFCRRCGARNGTGTAPTLTPPDEPLMLAGRLTPKMVTCPKGWKGVRDTRFYCPGCKKAVKKGEAYCHKCGQALIFPAERYDKENNRIWLDFSDRRPPEKEEET